MAYPPAKVDEALALVDSGLSHSEVGRRLDIPQVTISAWVRNRRIDPPPETQTTADPTKVIITDMVVDTITLTPSTTQIQVKKIPIASLILDAGTQMRESLNLVTISEYVERIGESCTFPPIIVFSDGTTYWLADGFQRVEATRQVGYGEIDAEVRPGTLRDAVLFAVGANSDHGERRNNADKRKAVCTLLADTEWRQWSDNHIAEVCRLSQSFVSDIRRSLKSALSDDQYNEQYHETHTRQYVDKHGNMSTMHTENIGKRATGERKIAETPLSDNSDNGVSHTPEPISVEADPPSRELFPEPETPSPCATCAAVVRLIDEAYEQFDRAGYLDIEQTLLTVRQLVTEKTAGHDE